MTAKSLIDKYLSFFVKKGHKIIPSASLVPENDPTVLFTTAGMHPLVPYLLGEPHPLGKRLASLQKCMRTDDIDSIGDTFHHTFFLMLGNWSLGDYFKKEAITWGLEFLTQDLKIPLSKISVTVFAGDSDAPRDAESAKIWMSLGIPKERIFYLPKKDNWWGPAGRTGPCGPDTEMFYDTGKPACGPDCKPSCSCGKYFEIWNDVFMEYNKKLKSQIPNPKSQKEEYYFEPLKQKNVDTGMGVERTIAVLNGLDDDYQTELFLPIIKKIEEISGKTYLQTSPSRSRSAPPGRWLDNKRAFRIIADHLRAATFIIADSVEPSNKERGYVLRRLIRRSIFYGRNYLGIERPFSEIVAAEIVKVYKTLFPEILETKEKILKILEIEENKFLQTIKRGYKEIEKYKTLDGKTAFYLYETYGFPWELTEEIARSKGQKIDKKIFEEKFRKHQEESREGTAQKFSGGLVDQSEEVTKLHTATHLLNQALREVLGKNVVQKGSNITAERLRFDFNYPEKLSAKKILEVENLVNRKIKENLKVWVEVTTLDMAIKKGAQAQFKETYATKVKVYFIDNFSIEICGGPHVDFTGKLGKFKIKKEESAGSNIRRIYATLN